MKKFKDILNEAKQVGTIFHYTSLPNAIKILDSGMLKSSSETGMLNKSVDNEGKNNISMSRNYGGHGDVVKDFGIVRLSFDGNKLSNKYKIVPFIDKDNFITRDIGEWEEQVRAKSINLNDYIIRVDILQNSKFDFGDALLLAEKWRKKKYQFKVNVVSKLQPIKRQDKFVVNTFA